MASNKTATDLIKTVLRRASIPNDQSTFSDADLIEIMNEEFMSNVLPVILKVHEEYYVDSVDVTIVGGKATIPYRAIGGRLREVHYVDASNSTSNMTRVSLEDLPDYHGSYGGSTPFGFYVKNDEIIMVGNSPSGTVRLYFFMRPNQIVENDRAGTITKIDTTTTPDSTIITVGTFPDNFSETVDYDFIGKRTPNKIKDYDIAATGSDSIAKTITFDTADITSTLVVGDFLLLAEETHIPQLPSELAPILSQRTAIKCLEAMGDTEAMTNASRELYKMEQNAYSLIGNRVEGAPQKVVNRNSTLKSGSSYFGSRRR